MFLEGWSKIFNVNMESMSGKASAGFTYPAI